MWARSSWFAALPLPTATPCWQGAVIFGNPDPGLAALIVATELDNDARKLTVRGKFGLQRFAQRIAKGKTIRPDAAGRLLDLCRTNLRELEVALPDAAGFYSRPL